jgi:predicted glycosyltransferase
MRALVYCHNVIGLGHIIRSMQIAGALADAGAEAILVTGCAALDSLAVDPRVRVERLPVARITDGARFEPRDPGLAGADILALRAARVIALGRELRPDVVLVDHHPFGLGGELLSVLSTAIAEAWPAHFAWGVPYTDGGLRIERQPSNPRVRDAVRRYESAIAYEARDAIDLIAEIPEWARPPRQYYAGPVVEEPLPPLPMREGLAAVVCGGGVTARDLCAHVLAARRLLPARAIALRVVVGPLGDPGEVRALAAAEPDIDVVPEGALRDAIRDAQIVVSRAGYNSAMQLLRTDVPLVFVPYAGGSGDQITRGRRLRGQPGVWVIDSAQPDREAALAAAMTEALASPRITRERPRADGARRAAAWLMEQAR